MILAAFRPDTKARLVEEGLLVPTVQMRLPPQPAQRALARGLLQRRRPPGGLRGHEIKLARMVSLANSIAARRHPAAGAHRACVEEDIGRRGRRLLRRGPLRAALRHPLGHRPGLALQGRTRRDDRLRRGDPRPERPAARLPLAAAAGRPGTGPDRAPRRRRPGATIELDWHEPSPGLRGEPGRLVPGRRRRLRLERRARLRPGDPQPAPSRPRDQRRYEPGPDGAPRIAAIDHADPSTPTPTPTRC